MTVVSHSVDRTGVPVVLLPVSRRRRRVRGVRRLWRRVRAVVPAAALLVATGAAADEVWQLTSGGDASADLPALCAALGGLVVAAHVRVRRERVRREAAASVRYIRRPWQPTRAACSTRARWSAPSSAWRTRSSSGMPAPTA